MKQIGGLRTRLRRERFVERIAERLDEHRESASEGVAIGMLVGEMDGEGEAATERDGDVGLALDLVARRFFVGRGVERNEGHGRGAHLAADELDDSRRQLGHRGKEYHGQTRSEVPTLAPGQSAALLLEATRSR